MSEGSDFHVHEMAESELAAAGALAGETTEVNGEQRHQRPRRDLRERLTGRDARTAAFACVTVASVSSANGGYFPTSWGWSAMVLLWLAALVALARSSITVSRLEAAAVVLVGGLTAWTLASILWTESNTETVLDVQRLLVYVAGIVAAVVVVRASSYRALLGGTWAAIVGVTGYGLLTRLFSGLFTSASVVAGNRLQEPVGYWNALGLMAALGCILGLGLVAHAHTRLVRAAASASLVPLSACLYFTFSRGSWVALGIGFLLLLAYETRRIQLLTATALAAPWAVAGVVLAIGRGSLTAVGPLGPNAVAEGRSLALELLALLAVAAAVSLPAGWALRRLDRPRLERAFSRVGLAVTIAGVLAALFAFGGPGKVAHSAWQAFDAPPAIVRDDLNKRLLSFSGSWRTELWRVAVEDAARHPIAGSGGGTYQRSWLEERRIGSQVINAHSIYLETLAETGAIGLILLVGLLALPLVATIRARRRSLVPAAAAAYTAFLAHAAVDWDWQITGVTLAALLCGVAALAAARPERASVTVRNWQRSLLVAVVLAVSAAAGVGLVGNRAARASQQATGQQRFAVAEREARKAITWMPWATTGLKALGDAQYAQGKLEEARGSYGKAIGKDPGDWQLWLDLALVSSGAERTAAADHARQLNPLSPEISEIATTLGLVP